MRHAVGRHGGQDADGDEKRAGEGHLAVREAPDERAREQSCEAERGLDYFEATGQRHGKVGGRGSQGLPGLSRAEPKDGVCNYCRYSSQAELSTLPATVLGGPTSFCFRGGTGT